MKSTSLITSQVSLGNGYRSPASAEAATQEEAGRQKVKAQSRIPSDTPKAPKPETYGHSHLFNYSSPFSSFAAFTDMFDAWVLPHSDCTQRVTVVAIVEHETVAG